MEKREHKIKNTGNLKQFWVRLWWLLRMVHSHIKKLLILILLIELLQFVGPYIVKLILDSVVDFKDEDIIKIILLVAGLFAVNLINSWIGYFAGKKAVVISALTENTLLKNAQKKMMYLDLAYHEKENTGNKTSKIRRGVDKIEVLLSDIHWQVAPTLIQVFLTCLILFWVDWRFGLVFVFFMPIFIYITFRLNNCVDPYRIKLHNFWEQENGKMTQSIININTVKSFSQEDREVREFGKLSDRVEKNIVKMFGIMFNYNIGRDFIINLGEVIIILFGAYLVWNNQITVGSLVFTITISQKALVSLYRISRLYDRIMDSSEAIERLYLLEHETSKIKNPENGIRPDNIAGEIKFDNVSFGYSDKEGVEPKDYALNNISVKINSGCVTALVGPSGGGKTTLARMIYRHYDPQKGKVLLDDKSLKKYDLYAFRKFIGIVPQEVEIFDMSIRDNIAYASPNASLQEVEAAARIANANEFIDKMPQKYKTEVGERGIKLSGGQRQRIGIARAVLANPRILIFDEATSSLDSYSEKLIQDAMSKIKKGRTMIIIAHRLSTIKKADKIIVLENGRVAEEGSHYELSQTKQGLYRKLLDLQKMGEIE